jgi:hypothetical protein
VARTKTQPVELTEEDWQEIAASLWTKAEALRQGRYAPCLKHGSKCTACDIAWSEHLERISEAIGPDGADAIERGVAPCR